MPSMMSQSLFTVPPQKKRGVGSCPYIIKITIICMNLIPYAAGTGQARKMYWCYEIKR